MAKENKAQNRTTGEDLDRSGFQKGKMVMYQLTDEEGAVMNEEGRLQRKVPAFITWNNDLKKRSPQGQIVVSLHIMRPAFLQGSFDKDDVPMDSGREPGTADDLQPGDAT